MNNLVVWILHSKKHLHILLTLNYLNQKGVFSNTTENIIVI